MKIKFLTLVFALFVSVGSAFSQTAPAPTPAPAPAPKAEPANIDGKWTLNADAPGQAVQIAVEFKQSGETFTGTTAAEIGNGTIFDGKINGNRFTATLKADVQGNLVDFAMEATVDGDKMSGTLVNAQFGTIAFTATKNK